MKLYLTGSDGITKEITGLLTKTGWSGDNASIARKVTFSIVHQEDSDWPVPELGGGITLEHEGEKLFTGYVVKRTLDSESSTMDCVCYDRGLYLTNNEGTYKFRGWTAEKIAAAVCADRDIPVSELVSTGVSLNRKFSGTKLDQIIRTAYSLAAEQTGKRYAIRMRPEGLAVTERSQSESSVELRARSNLMYATTTESIADMVNSVGIYDKNGTRITTVEDKDAIALYGTMEEHVTESTGSDARAEAESMLEDGQLSRNVTVEVLGDTRLVTGETVAVQESGTGLAGIFWIDSDTHTWQRGQYTCKLTLNYRNVMKTASAGSVIK